MCKVETTKINNLKENTYILYFTLFIFIFLFIFLLRLSFMMLMTVLFFSILVGPICKYV